MPDVAADVKSLALSLDTAPTVGVGKLSERPSAGAKGDRFLVQGDAEENNGIEWVCVGGAWVATKAGENTVGTRAIQNEAISAEKLAYNLRRRGSVVTAYANGITLPKMAAGETQPLAISSFTVFDSNMYSTDGEGRVYIKIPGYYRVDVFWTTSVAYALSFIDIGATTNDPRGVRPYFLVGPGNYNTRLFGQTSTIGIQGGASWIVELEQEGYTLRMLGNAHEGEGVGSAAMTVSYVCELP